MAIQNGYRKKIDFSTDEWEDIQPQNQEININDLQGIQLEQPKQMPQVQKNFESFGTGGINMIGLRAPITGALTATAGLIGKVFGKNKKSIYENYQDGVDFVNNENQRAKELNPTNYYIGNIATGIPLSLAAGKKTIGSVANKISSPEIIGALKGGGKELLKSTLKDIATGNTLTNFAKYKIADVLFDKFFSGGK